MIPEYCRLYVVETLTPGFFYVGHTDRQPHCREDEHASGKGSYFTKKHGFKRMMFFHRLRDPRMCQRLEDDFTIALMCQLGWGCVRGGNRVALHEHKLRRWLPPCLQELGPRDILPLHLRPVSKFGPELATLLDRFEVVRGLEDSD